jgi:hypothetical protein
VVLTSITHYDDRTNKIADKWRMTSQSESVTKKKPRLGPEMEYITTITDSEQAEGRMIAVHDS